MGTKTFIKEAPDKTVVGFSRNKRLKALLVGVLIVIAAGLAAYYTLHFRNSNGWLTYGFLFAGICALGVYMVVCALRNLMSCDQNGFIANAEGFVFKGTPMGKKIGFVSWRDVEVLKYTPENINLQLSNKEEYIGRFPNKMMRELFEKNGLTLNCDELTIRIDELTKLMDTYWTKYSGKA